MEPVRFIGDVFGTDKNSIIQCIDKAVGREIGTHIAGGVKCHITSMKRAI